MKDKVVTINPFIAPKATDIPEVRQTLGRQDRFRIVTIGAWEGRYNVEEAAEASSIFSRTVDVPVELTVIQSTGSFDADYKQWLEQRLEELSSNIKIEVFEDSSKILELLADHDVFIRSSKGDSYGLCVAESLLVGTPAIATDLCRRCEGTLLYKQGNMKILQEHLKEIFERRKLPRRKLLLDSQDSFHAYVKEYNAFA